MPLFQCEKCKHVDSTAYGQHQGYDEKLCTECATGKWHNNFDKIPAKGFLIDSEGFLHPKTKRRDLLDYIKIVGEVE